MKSRKRATVGIAAVLLAGTAAAAVAVVSAACISLHASGRSWLRGVVEAFLPRKVPE